ncbi:MAG: hypothetical protein JWR58_3053 [Pseudonocardia sp.]|nr:hypothetical protein [Pseudonocardia sp.]
MSIRHAVGQPHIENRDVRAQRGDAGHRLGGGTRFADDLNVVLGLEQLCDAAPDDLVIVEQKHGDGHRVSLSSPGGRDDGTLLPGGPAGDAEAPGQGGGTSRGCGSSGRLFSGWAGYGDEVDRPLRVSALVVVPAEDLDHAPDRARQGTVEQTGRRLADHVV